MNLLYFIIRLQKGSKRVIRRYMFYRWKEEKIFQPRKQIFTKNYLQTLNDIVYIITHFKNIIHFYYLFYNLYYNTFFIIPFVL